MQLNLKNIKSHYLIALSYTILTKEMIVKEFGYKIANQVEDLTRIKENGIKISVAEMVELLYTEKKYDILLIKLFDRLHNIQNMQTIGAKSPEKGWRTILETLQVFLTIATYLKIPNVTGLRFLHLPNFVN